MSYCFEKVSSSVLAGTISEVGVGKFANGAISAAYSMLFNELGHGNQKTKQLKTLENKLEAKLEELQIGQSITRDELGKALGMKEISTVISKITRRNEKTYTIKQTLIGTTFLKDTPMNIEHTTLMIRNKPETVYRFRISYKSWNIK